jgi:NADPH-dependent glutamate synthase beta subunit-like oxidoreductase/glutamate synthase domain-containing protein 3/NAD-dependent dihydropyrimidine dehydrogenase PreA subunit
MKDKQYLVIEGRVDGIRLESRILEEQIQDAVNRGHRRIKVHAVGQHGLGGRLWRAGTEAVFVSIDGPTGQRVGSMGFPNTHIEILGHASDDVGWLNAGATITIHGNTGNGACNAMAQGKVRVAGSIGARGMTMTKRNPRFDPPELWVLGSVGDYFGEFMAGGTVVVCGHHPQTPDNVLGYRPLVGMVGGRVFFRGPHMGFSQVDAKMIPLEESDYDWLVTHLESFLKAVHRPELFAELSDRSGWQLITARSPQEKTGRKLRSMKMFHEEVWDRELGKGGIIGDLTDVDRRPIPVITSGYLRRWVPVWENRKYLSPCQASCPTGIPVQERWRLIRSGKMDESVDLALSYTPFPATVCGYLCPSPCMQACTRQSAFMIPLDIAALGKASINAKTPVMPPESGKQIAVIGGGPAGISVAWQLRRRGHRAVVYDREGVLGGKISAMIPNSRIPKDVMDAELDRVRATLPHIHLQQDLSKDAFEQLKEDYDFVVVAVGAQKPRILPIPGIERTVVYSEFLKKAKVETLDPGNRVVVIGAGNVGCDVATEAHRLGARDITLIDVQEPASFGKERADAEAAGAKFRWPCFTREISAEGVVLTDGEVIPADTVVISIGDSPDLDFLPESVVRERGFIDANEFGQSSDPQVFAIGDAVRLGLLTDAIGAGRIAAGAISDILEGKRPVTDFKRMIDIDRVTLEYFDPRLAPSADVDACGSQCSSCGSCRDCHICETVCPQAAISRREAATEAGYEYVVDAERCIGCGFCAGACPCGIWDLVQNDPIE